jgi:hypothetical protein
VLKRKSTRNETFVLHACPLDAVLALVFDREWIELLRMVRVMSEKKIRGLMEGEVDPHNALGTIDLADIDAVQAINNPKKFAMIKITPICSYLTPPTLSSPTHLFLSNPTHLIQPHPPVSIQSHPPSCPVLPTLITLLSD